MPGRRIILENEDLPEDHARSSRHIDNRLNRVYCQAPDQVCSGTFARNDGTL